MTENHLLKDYKNNVDVRRHINYNQVTQQHDGQQFQVDNGIYSILKDLQGDTKNMKKMNRNSSLSSVRFNDAIIQEKSQKSSLAALVQKESNSVLARSNLSNSGIKSSIVIHSKKTNDLADITNHMMHVNKILHKKDNIRKSSKNIKPENNVHKTDPEELYDFHKQVEKLKNRALDEGEQTRFDYYFDQDHGKSIRHNAGIRPVPRPSKTDLKSPEKENRLFQYKQSNHIPYKLEERSKQHAMIQTARQSMSKSKSKSQLRYAQTTRSPEFKNEFKSDIDVKVGLDMLHTDELMGYYKEVLNKGKRDLITHQRQQNLIKKIENI